jgi:hypothetical protein
MRQEKYNGHNRHGMDGPIGVELYVVAVWLFVRSQSQEATARAMQRFHPSQGLDTIQDDLGAAIPHEH